MPVDIGHQAVYYLVRRPVKGFYALPEGQPLYALRLVHVAVGADHDHLRHVFEVVQVLEEDVRRFVPPGAVASAVAVEQVEHRVGLFIRVVRRQENHGVAGGMRQTGEIGDGLRRSVVVAGLLFDEIGVRRLGYDAVGVGRLGVPLDLLS